MNNTDALTGKLLEIINQVQGAVSAHSADAVSLVLTSTRIDGVFWIISLLVSFLISSYVIYLFASDSNDNEGAFLIALIAAIISFLCLIYPWNWIQVFDPKLYLAHQIINSFLS